MIKKLSTALIVVQRWENNMNNYVSGLIGFVAGAAAGAATTYFVMKDKMEMEIEEVRQIYRQKIEEDLDGSLDEWKNSVDKYQSSAPSEKPAPALITKNLFEEHKSQMNGDYVDYGNHVPEDTDDEDEIDPEYEVEHTEFDNPQTYIISPAEFGEHDDFDTVSLTWYADQILADDMDPKNPIEDVEEYFPFDFLASFGEYEDDAIHVRNERLKTDYEVLRDTARWEDQFSKKKKSTKSRRPDDILDEDE